MGYSKRSWACPYFKWDERMCVHCENGTRVRFAHTKSRNRYYKLYCANNPGWNNCTVADALNKHYEEMYKNGK